MSDNIWHVFPMNDTAEHQLTTDVLHIPAQAVTDESKQIEYRPAEDRIICRCTCLPIIQKQFSGSIIVIHNSFDGREGLEWANEILDKYLP